MALNLGDINFGLGVDTQRLGKSVKDVVNFGASVEAAARRTGKGAKAAATDLQKQERAALAAIQQTLRFNEQLRKAKAPTKMFTDSTNALRELTNWMTQGRLKTLAYQRVLEKFDADLGRNKRNLDHYIQSLKEGATPAERFANRLRNLSSSATLTLGPLSGLGARISALAGIATRADIVVAAMIGSIAAGAVVLGRMSQAAVQTAQQLDQVRARFEITSGIAAAGDDFERIRQLAEDAGTEFITTANAFTRLQAAARGTSMEGVGVDKVFEDLLFGISKFQLSQDEMDGALKAFEQMMSKGVVQAEELRGQLGDRIPGAFNIAAQAMGVTTQELNDMLRAGEVATADFLPKFAAGLRAAVGADQVSHMESFRATMNRLTNAQTHFSDELDRTFGISKAYQSVVILLTNVLNLLANNMDTVASLAGAISGAMLAFAGPRILSGLVTVVKLIKDATLAMIGLNAATMANPLGALASVLARVGVVAAGAAASYYMMSKNASSASADVDALNSTIDEFLQTQRASQTTNVDIASQFIADINDQIQALQNARLVQQARLRELNEEFGSLSPGQLDMLMIIDPPGGRLDEWRDLVKEIGVQGLKDIPGMDVLQQRMRELQKIIDDAAAAEEALQQKRQERQRRALEDSTQSITRLLQEADAYRGMTGEVERLQESFRKADAVAKFRKELEDLSKEDGSVITLEDITRQVEAFSAALDIAAASAQVSRIKNILEPLAAMREELAALRKGPDAYETFTNAKEAISTIRGIQDELLRAGATVDEVNSHTRELVRTMNELERQRAANRLHKAFADADKELAILQRRIAAMREGPKALERLDAQLDIDRQVEEFERNLREAATAHELLENAFDLPQTIADTETAADRLKAALERIGQLSGLDAGIIELITSLDTAITRVGTLSGGLTGLSVTPTAPGADFIGPPMPPGMIVPSGDVPSGVVLNPAMHPLTALTGEESHMTTADAGTNMSSLLTTQFARMQDLFGQAITINDAIAKAGTSREKNTPGSQHFHGNALDLSLAGMDDATRIKLVQAALSAGFTGFGFGSNILHVDVGPSRAWSYGNSTFGGQSVADLKAMVTGAESTQSSRSGTIPATDDIDRRVAEYRAGLEAMAAAENAYTQTTALKDAQLRIDRLNEEIAAYSTNTRAVETLQAQFARRDEIRAFQESLETAGVAQEVVNQKVREFQALLERRDALQEQISAAREFADVVGAQLNTALDGTAKAFADAIVAGEGLSALADLGRQVASEILAAFLKLYVLKPLLDGIFPGTFGIATANVNGAPGTSQGQTTGGGDGGSGSGGGFGNILGSITDSLAGWFGTIFSRKGNAFEGGLLQDVQMFRKGGILSGPTLFSTASGPAIGGEAGDEAIVPLVRSSSGDLGIRSIGSAGDTTVNFNFPPGTDVPSFRKSESQLAAMAGSVLRRGNV